MAARGRRRRGRLAAALVVAAFAPVFQGLVYLLISRLHLDENLSLEVASALYMAVAVCLLGGRRMLAPSRAPFQSVWRLAWPILAISLALTCTQVAGYASGTERLSPNWAQNVAYYVVFCLCIGIYEECYVRGVLLGGLLSRFGRSRGALWACIAVSSVYFGVLHIDWAGLNCTSPLELAQAVLKVAQTGIYGAVLSAAVVENDNLTGAILFHALDDFSIMVIPYALFGEGLSTNYVSSGREEAMSSIVLYAVLCVLYLPSLWHAIRRTRTLPQPHHGGFVMSDAGEKCADACVRTWADELPAPPAGMPHVPAHMRKTAAQEQCAEPGDARVR